MRSPSRSRVAAAVTIAFAMTAGPGGAQSAQPAHTRDEARAAERRSVPMAAFVVDTTVRRTPFDTSALDIPSARRLAGCYTVRVGAWSDPHVNGGHVWTPTEIRLDTISAARPLRGFSLVAETPGSANPSHFAQPARWAPVRQDSLQATIVADGTSSVTIFARRHADGTFTAIARYLSDGIAVDPVTKRWLWETYPTAPVQLTPHACASAR